IGSGEEISILGLAETIAQTVGFTGTIDTDPGRPDGTMRKLSAISRIRDTGWTPQISLLDGLGSAYDSFLQETNNDTLRAV
ncbi:MAG: GDP-L-fucose synthase, partial [Fuerstiella sp.]